MKSKLLALIAGTLLLLAVEAGPAAAEPPAVQTIGQQASSAQAAQAASGAVQAKPSNANISVRVLSPGNNGAVTQTNDASSSAAADNANATGQTAGQAQTGAGGLQSVGQLAGNQQAAGALSGALQAGASNTNLPVRVLSPGDDGAVSQTNAADSQADADNANATDQTAKQSQDHGSCGCGPGGGSQSTGQAASSTQLAGAASEAKQLDPQNTNIAVRVLSPGDDGSVQQANTVDSTAKADNANTAGQTAMQSQGGGSSSGAQSVGQAASSGQAAGALSGAAQLGASNDNAPVSVLSPGSGGDVSQTNEVRSSADAGNSNAATQRASQGEGGRLCECARLDGVQSIGQSASSEQKALAASLAIQKDAENDNVPVRVLSPGDEGSVEQANTVDSTAKADNANTAGQTATQSQDSGHCGCSGGLGIQAIGQQASSSQAVLAASAALQWGAENTNDPVRVLSPGGDGSERQSNTVDSTATAGNAGATSQSAAETQGSGGGIGIQAVGQLSTSKQLAAAFSLGAQLWAANVSDPVRVLSPGGGGSVEQANDASSDAEARNRNTTSQSTWLSEVGRCLCLAPPTRIQAVGQSADNAQLAFGLSKAAQVWAGNGDSPVRAESEGDGGSLSLAQSNGARSRGGSLNANATRQAAAGLEA